MSKGRSQTLSAARIGTEGASLLGTLAGRAAAILIRAYQLILSPVLPGSCRFHPSCSRYALEAFRRHSFPRALWLSVRRIARCHPFHSGGDDPVP